MNSDASAAILPIIHENLRFNDENGNEFVPISIPRIEHNGRGHPDHRGIMTLIKVAVLAESRIAIEALIGLDVRALLPEDYPAKAVSQPDQRSAQRRRDDAEALVAAKHAAERKHFKSLCEIRVGYSISEIIKRGPAAVKKHYGPEKAPNLNKFMRNENRQYALDALPGENDQQLANIRLDLLGALLTAWAKWEEILVFQRKSRKQQKNGQPGRPSKRQVTQKNISSAPLKYSSKIEYDNDQLHFIAAHSEVNPTYLWTHLGAARPVFDYQVMFGKYNRGILWSENEISFFNQYVAPFMLGQKMPENRVEEIICQKIGWQLEKWENTARRQGKTTVFSNPVTVEYFRQGAKLTYEKGVFKIDTSPIFER